MQKRPRGVVSFLVVLIAVSFTDVRAQEPGSAPPVLDPAAAGPAQRIWHARVGEEVWMRRRFSLPREVSSARIVASCDDKFELFVDGRPFGGSGMWEELVVAELGELKAGEHVIAVHAENRGGPAALALWLTWSDGSEPGVLVSDKSFRVSDAAPDDWRAVKFDDRKWEAAWEQGATPFARNVYGMEPGGHRFFNQLTATTADIAAALEALNRTKDDAGALRSLDEIEQAVMRARRAIRDRQVRRERMESRRKEGGTRRRAPLSPDSTRRCDGGASAPPARDIGDTAMVRSSLDAR